MYYYQLVSMIIHCLLGLHCLKSVQIRSFFWSVFSRIWTEYGEMLRISPYSVWMWENTDQKKLRIWTHLTQCIISVSIKKILSGFYLLFQSLLEFTINFSYYSGLMKFYITRNSNNTVWIETAHSYCWVVFLKWFRKVHVQHAFLINDDKILSLLLNL